MDNNADRPALSRLVTLLKIGQQRCEDCNLFMAEIGIGGLCPHCDGAVAVKDLGN